MKEKVKQLINNTVIQIKPKLLTLDTKFQSLIPNPKLRKILYYSVGGLFAVMFLIMLLGIILMPFRKKSDTQAVINKPKIIVSSPIPQKELNETEKKLLDLQNKIKDLKFPESILNIPVIESKIKI